ncbi:DUF924 family protein [Ketobacter sp.]
MPDNAEDRKLQALSAVVERFGRFPHRNTLLGRSSTAEEETYLNSDENKFR